MDGTDNGNVMAQLYGGRWQIASDRPLGQGGQSHVFRVVDISGALPGEYALKRVLNPKRNDRFRSEVEAITRLRHPNIVTLIDHSALDAGDQDSEKQFLVMPIAVGGDLSEARRLGYYKESIGSVLQIAKQIALALGAAHAEKVIHRDVKPQNILFTDNGHELWVADFGICLIQDRPRSTETGEVVGPRAFLAPELEGGGELDVTPAADVYSLGKVIYYALSGGMVLPRERLDEPTYSQIFGRGERYRLVEYLLRQMICPLAQRIQSMVEVAKRLEDIETWEQKARLVPIGREGLSALDRLQTKVLEEQRAVAENAAKRASHQATLAHITDGFKDWLQSELQKAAAQISAAGVFTCTVGAPTSEPREQWMAAWGPANAFLEIVGLELRLDRDQSGRVLRDLLQVRLCQRMRAPQVTIQIKGTSKNSPCLQCRSRWSYNEA